MIRPLTSLRFFAALMVVGHHYVGFAAGYAGVGFFFVLSGYVLGVNYAGRVSTPEERRNFWWRRFARIYPTHILTFVFALPLKQPFLDTLPSIPLLQSWLPFQGIQFVANAPSWSISNEVFFYALFPLLIGIRWRVLALWGAALLALALAWPNWSLEYHFAVHGLKIMPTHYLFYIFPPTRIFEFALGVALARLPGNFTGKHEAGALTLAAASIVALPYLPPAIGAALFFVPASVVLVYVFARSSGPIARVLSNRSLVLLGDASFMLYMVHYPLGRYLGVGLATALLSVCLSVLLFWYFEKPVQRWLLKLVERSRREQAVTAS